jgi:CBS domain-containing protein
VSWTVDKVMTTRVITARPSTGYKELARLLNEHAVSALPVVDVVGDERRLVGIVSEADLLAKKGPNAWRHLAAGSRGEKARPEALTAADLMTSPAVTVQAEDSLAQAARLMHRKKVKRLPVMDATGRLVGIVSRGDLVKPFLRSDESIRHEIRNDVLVRTLHLDPEAVHVSVNEGVVKLGGELESKRLVAVLRRLVRSMEGVVGVDARLTSRPEGAPSDLSGRAGTPGRPAGHWRR